MFRSEASLLGDIAKHDTTEVPPISLHFFPHLLCPRGLNCAVRLLLRGKAVPREEKASSSDCATLGARSAWVGRADGGGGAGERDSKEGRKGEKVE